MIYRLLADFVLVVHLGFVIFVVAGGLLVLRKRTMASFHLPAAAWGVLVQMTGRRCPLTPLENQLRLLGGQAGYSGGFVEHYLLSVLYPAGLTREIQIILGTVVLVVNLIVYGSLIASWLRSRSNSPTLYPAGRPLPGSAVLSQTRE